MSLTHPSMVLSVFIRTLGGSNALVGLLPAIRFGGWFLPQFLVASWVQPIAEPFYTVFALDILGAPVSSVFSPFSPGSSLTGWALSRFSLPPPFCFYWATWLRWDGSPGSHPLWIALLGLLC